MPVERMQNAHPYVKVDGKIVPADGTGSALVKTKEYMPVFVSIKDFDVKEIGWESTDSIHDFNVQLRIHATFTTPYLLENAYFVLETSTDKAGKALLGYEIGTLKPRESKTVSLLIPLKESLGEGELLFHVFSNGYEVLTSKLPPAYCDTVLDQMIASRLDNVENANPAPFVGPAPEYPKALLKSKRTGRAIITLRIGANGRVYDPVIKEATDPSFGDAALTAVRLWRFLPRVKNGHPVDVKINLPFDFAPPPETAEKS